MPPPDPLVASYARHEVPGSESGVRSGTLTPRFSEDAGLTRCSTSAEWGQSRDSDPTGFAAADCFGDGAAGRKCFSLLVFGHQRQFSIPPALGSESGL